MWHALPVVEARIHRDEKGDLGAPLAAVRATVKPSAQQRNRDTGACCCRGRSTVPHGPIPLVCWFVLFCFVFLCLCLWLGFFLPRVLRRVVSASSMVLQLVFESLESPSLYITNTATLSLYTSGRETGLVVDAGHNGVDVVPVYESVVLNHASQRVPVGGHMLTLRLQALLQSTAGCTVDEEVCRKVKEAVWCVHQCPKCCCVTWVWAYSLRPPMC